MFARFVTMFAIMTSGLAPKDMPVDAWIAEQTKISQAKLLQNIAPSQGLPGAVIASPERQAPNYYFHWTRDSALAYMTVIHLFENVHGHDRESLKSRVLSFADFSAALQRLPLGEPKFYLDGRAFDGGWGPGRWRCFAGAQPPTRRYGP
jgi:glucoamylase